MTKHIKSINPINQINQINPINPTIIRLIKNAYIKNFIVYNHYNISNMIKKISDQYMEPNNDIYILSMIYNYPAQHLLKLIFKHIYPTISNNEINLLFQSDNITNQFITSKDVLNIELSKIIDNYSNPDEELQAKYAIEFEDNINKLLNKNHIKFQTQDDLVKEQIEAHGRAISTPDFLLIDDLFYLDKKIKWIDAKNFYGANTHFIKNKIKKQITKYVNNYGFGCIIFAHGFSQQLYDFFSSDVLFLTYDQFNIKSSNH